MSDVVWNETQWSEQPDLRRPLLLMAFEGLFDAAEAATTALEQIEQRSDATELAEIDPETFFNFQETRPTVRIGEDGERRIDWPTTRVVACRTAGPRDLVLMTGVEPQLRWRGFADAVVEVAHRSGAEMVVTVGAMVAMVPHTRPFPITGSAADAVLAERLGLDRPSYEGPTGVVGVINQRLHDAGVPIISVRVGIPHYVPGAPNPKATSTLLRRLEQTTRVETGYADLDPQVTGWVARVDAAVASDDESREYVQRLEAQFDSNEETLPSGDEIAGELEAFLRDRDPGDADPLGDTDPPGDPDPGNPDPPVD